MLVLWKLPELDAVPPRSFWSFLDPFGLQVALEPEQQRNLSWGLRPISGQATKTVSRSCSLTSQKCRNTEEFQNIALRIICESRFVTIRINFQCQKLREIFSPELRKFFGIAGVKRGRISWKNNRTWRFFLRWKTMDLALTFLSLMSTLFPQRTMGMFSQTRVKSRCQFGTFLYVTREVTSNIITAHCPSN